MNQTHSLSDINKKLNKISFIIPLYNEEKRLNKSLETLYDFFSKFNYDYEIIFVDDGSSDNSYTTILDFIKKNKLHNYKIYKIKKNFGKGYAVKYGILNCDKNSDLYFFMDTDLSTPLNEINRFINYYNKNNNINILIGSRGLTESKIVKRQVFYRMFMGKIFNKLLKVIVGTKFTDTQCGFKMFDKSSKNMIFPKLKINRFAFDAEIIYLADKFKLIVKDLPVTWINSENSKVNIIKDSYKMLKDLFKIKYYWYSGKYEN
jgi:dolichyl-phosphate beta-glucosyltransferase